MNLAIALKGQGKDKECLDLLSRTDFSALALKFKLSNSVLIEDYDSAKETMIRIGKSGDISDSNYREWPLFRWFRKTDQFKQAYQEVFGIEYAVTEDLVDHKRETTQSITDETSDKENPNVAWAAQEDSVPDEKDSNVEPLQTA